MRRLALVAVLVATAAVQLGAASSANAAYDAINFAVENSSCTATGELEANLVDSSTNQWSFDARTGGVVTSGCRNVFYKVQVNCTFRNPDGTISTRSIGLAEDGPFTWGGTDYYAAVQFPAPGVTQSCAGPGGTRARLVQITGIHWARNGGGEYTRSSVTRIPIP
jgi:hypothetical protein